MRSVSNRVVRLTEALVRYMVRLDRTADHCLICIESPGPGWIGEKQDHWCSCSIIVSSQVTSEHGLKAEHPEEVMVDHHRRHAIRIQPCRQVDGSACAIHGQGGEGSLLPFPINEVRI